MKTLIENLYTNNVIFSYYGFIDDSVLRQVLEISKSKLETNKEPMMVVKKVYDAIKECTENIVKHNFYEEDSKVRYKSLLIVSKKGDEYNIDTVNVINSAQRESITEQLDYLQSRSTEELIDLKSKIEVNTGNSMVVSSGLVDLVLKADKCDCSFKEMPEHSLFNINYRVSTFN
jgi:hypothetical protein